MACLKKTATAPCYLAAWADLNPEKPKTSPPFGRKGWPWPWFLHLGYKQLNQDKKNGKAGTREVEAMIKVGRVILLQHVPRPHRPNVKDSNPREDD